MKLFAIYFARGGKARFDKQTEWRCDGRIFAECFVSLLLAEDYETRRALAARALVQFEDFCSRMSAVAIEIKREGIWRNSGLNRNAHGGQLVSSRAVAINRKHKVIRFDIPVTKGDFAGKK